MAEMVVASCKLKSIQQIPRKSEPSAKQLATITGYECEFVDQPPKRSECPICLLVLREPHQAACCGKIFCKACIYKISNKEQPCPTCKTEGFSCYPDKGLKQELHGFRVYCPNKRTCCKWVGELGELDKHLNLNPEKANKMQGCRFVNMDCIYCSGQFQRCSVERHQSAECGKRPFTCEMCQEYKSTYNDVMFFHLVMCKYRPVDCPNQCGGPVLFHELDEHLSNHCELSQVKCEFNRVGCEAKMPRKDLSSHLSHDVVNHVSLLAAENVQLKLALKDMRLKLRLHDDLEKRVKSLELERSLMRRCFSRLPPFYARFPWSDYISPLSLLSATFKVINPDVWLSKEFYSHIGGYKLQLKVWCPILNSSVANTIRLSYKVLDSEFDVNSQFKLFIATSVVSPDSVTVYVQKKLECCASLESECLSLSGATLSRCFSNDVVMIRVDDVEVIE